jgi:HEAT repeat protein
MTINDSEAEALLDEIRAEFDDPTAKHAHRHNIWVKLHTLAEKRYGPAFELFVRGLDDPDSAWRYVYLRNFGFHYAADDLRPYLNRIRALLQNDPDEDVRRTAASVIERISTWPDQALLHALENDEDGMVRETAFESLLMQLGVPMAELRTLRYELRQRGVDVTVGALKEIAARSGLSIDSSAGRE